MDTGAWIKVFKKSMDFISDIDFLHHLCNKSMSIKHFFYYFKQIFTYK